MQILNTVSPAKRLMYVMMGGAGLVLLSSSGIILGLNSKLTTLQTSAQQKDAEVTSSEQIARKYQTTLDEYNDTQGRIKFLETAVSSKSYVPTLLQQLQTLAAQTHLTVMSVRPEMAPPAPPVVVHPSDSTAPAADTKKVLPPAYDTINVDVDVIGTYQDTSAFLYSLTRFPKIISLTSAQMHPNAAPTNTPGAANDAPAVATVTTNLKLVAFMFHDDDTATAPTQTAATITPVSGLPYTTIPPASVGTISAAAGRVAVGAAAATRASNARTAVGLSSL